MSTAVLIELETRLRRPERQKRILILLLLGFAGIGSIVATNRRARILLATNTKAQGIELPGRSIFLFHRY
jgi:hypothetical protein